ncbi:MAG TPA: helicase C-terminal domain-containing protein, partial [Syntrophomonadaceae bacterium]|nr:helicase C-terminal domain-containing protein [Syntrophomonadaceae bacterium]
GYTLTGNMFLAAEVGTGVGKTFGYLIPAILFALHEGQKVIVSTRTRALQEQILNHDVPDLKKVMEVEFTAVEARGRENYLCWNKYINIISGRKSLEDNQLEFINSILSWAEKTKIGDRKELSLNSELMKNWSLVAADRNSCIREQCRYHDRCFRLKMLKSLEKANIIIVNHALLLSDLLTQHSILPEYEYLIIDEAHTFNRESFERLSTRFSKYDNNIAYDALFNSSRGGRGYLAYLRGRFPNLAPPLYEAIDLVKRGVELNNELFQTFGTIKNNGEEFNYTRIVRGNTADQLWIEEAFPVYADWQANQNLLIKKLEHIVEELNGDDDGLELTSIIAVLAACGDSGFKVMEEDLEQEDYLVWIEYDHSRAVALCSSLISTGDTIDARLYQKLKALIMVSATLTIEDQFDHFVHQNGLANYMKQERLYCLLEKSPFNYEKQSCLYLVKDMPDISDSRFETAVGQVLLDVINAVGGNILVLFTARKQLRQVSEMLRPLCEKNHIRLLVQYEDGDFGTLMDEFTASGNTVLMGLETFWEGVDLKGDLLRCLVIVKLPFRSPADPYCSAWEKYCNRQGRNSFMEFMLPDAAVRFKQGVGRLIRSEQDRGAVIVLDTRLTGKRYGKIFLNSIPIKNVMSLNRHDIGRFLNDWI